MRHVNDQLADAQERNRELLIALIDATADIVWMSGSNDFAPEGQAHKGWLQVKARLVKYLAIIRAEGK